MEKKWIILIIIILVLASVLIVWFTRTECNKNLDAESCKRAGGTPNYLLVDCGPTPCPEESRPFCECP